MGGIVVWLDLRCYRHGSFYRVSELHGKFTNIANSSRAITAFALELYPAHSTSVSAIINMWRTCGGFSVSYFQAAWIKRNGAGVVFGIQAAIVSVVIVLTIVPVLWMGKRHVANRD
jgi:hypothetical protein